MFHQHPPADGHEVYTFPYIQPHLEASSRVRPRESPAGLGAVRGRGGQGWLSAWPEAGGLLTDACSSQQSLLHPTVIPEILLQEEYSRRCWDKVVEKANHILDTVHGST